MAVRARRTGRRASTTSLSTRPAKSRSPTRSPFHRAARERRPAWATRHSSRRLAKACIRCTPATPCCSICSATTKRFRSIAAFFSTCRIACSRRSARTSPTRRTKDRLTPNPATQLHAVLFAGERRAGLEYLPIEHDGNSSASPEEADAIVREILRLREGEVVDSWPAERAGIARPLEDRDIIVVTPYNAQRRLIKRKLQQPGSTVEVGTVDKFQGREAAVVFYSMATSSGEQVPRDDGVSLREKPVQRCDLAGARAERSRLQSSFARHRVPHARSNGAGQLALRVRRARWREGPRNPRANVEPAIARLRESRSI